MLRHLTRALGVLILCGAALVAPTRADETGDVTALLDSGRTSEALAQLDRLLAAKPRDAQLRFLKGVALSVSGRRTEAAATFEQLSVDYPEMPEPYNNLAVIYAAQGDYDKARAALENALRARPNYAVARQNLGDIHLQLARQSYEQALKLDPANATIPPKLALLRGIIKPVAAAASAGDTSLK